MKNLFLKHRIHVRWSLSAFFLSVLFLAGIVFLLHRYYEYRRNEPYEKALALLASGKTRDGIQLLAEYIQKNPGHLAATAALARQMEKEKRWRAAMSLWARAGAVEAKPEYVKSEFFCMAMCRKYRILSSRLEKRKDLNSISREQKYLLALCYYFTDQKHKMEFILADIPASSAPPSSEVLLLNYFLESFPASSQSRKAALEDLLKSRNEWVVFEALREKLSIAVSEGDGNAAAEVLRKMKEIQPEYAAVASGDYDLRQGRADLAISDYSESLYYFLDPDMAVKLGELLAVEKDAAGLRQLTRKFQHGSRKVLQTGLYLEALAAFVENNPGKVAEHMDRIPGFHHSATFNYLSLLSAMYQEDTDEVCRIAKEIKPDPLFNELFPKARPQQIQYVEILLKRKLYSEAAPLAKLLDDPQSPNRILTSVILLDELETGIIPEFEISHAIRSFPDDPVIFEIAAANALAQKNFEKALRFALQNLRTGNTSSDILFQLFAAYDGLGKTDEAVATLRKLRSRSDVNPTAVFKMFSLYCIRNGRFRELQSLHTELSAGFIPEAKRLQPLLEAEIACWKNNPKKAIALIQESLASSEWKFDDPDDLEFLYQMAVLLTRSGDYPSAIRLYDRIYPLYPGKALIQVKLSELYALSGEKEKALHAAHSAWLLDSRHPMTQEAYGMRLAQAGKYEKATEVLSLLLDLKEVPPGVAEAWRVSMEQLLKQQFRAKDYFSCRKNSQLLLSRFPKNGTALEYLQKLRAAAR